MQPQANEGLNLWKQKTNPLSSRDLGVNTALSASQSSSSDSDLDFGLSEPREKKKCCFKTPFCGNLLQQLQETNPSPSRVRACSLADPTPSKTILQGYTMGLFLYTTLFSKNLKE